ncbi:hypothetical protein [Desulfobacter sp.]|uniref:hypothetical protein n=1 Tax=Desulfobacter sp. TaxID=2294 RepID=UPI000E9993C4|nr:hypothetical protein [Desulfobacter sp.]HBT89898.1 hypothetical protein [Desulfobacter sp.]
MLKSIKQYLKKAGEEASQEYTIAPRRSSEENNSAIEPWIGVDLDGTLAFYDKHSSVETVGDPVPAMMTLLKDMIDKGTRVKIFTARASAPEQLPIIRKWLKIQGLPDLEITNVKDYSMVRLYDDRCIQVETNTGRLIVDKSI